MFKKIGVVGAGVMGSGIGQLFASKGFNVIIQDVKDEFCERGFDAIEKSLWKLVEKGKISREDHDRILSDIRTTTSVEELKDVEFVIEAATEREELKREIFAKLDSVVSKNVILATNTSSISIAKIASATQRPEKVVGMHFMNPAPVMKGVEIIRGPKTSAETEKTVIGLAENLGKTVVRSKDSAGFIANRVLMPMINEAAYALQQGVAEGKDIDICMVACCNFPMGPLALADLIGLDTVRSILNVMHAELGDPKYKPCPLIDEYVEKGWLGRKSGKGFYEY